jgi:hypothetical protein
MVRTSAVETVFDAQRLTLARQALSLTGGNAETLTVEELARRMVPVIRELVQRAIGGGVVRAEGAIGTLD